MAAIGREHAVAEEMPVRAGFQLHHGRAVDGVEHDGEAAGPAGEDDGLVAGRPQGHGVAAVGQRQLEQHLADRIQPGDGEIAVQSPLRAEEADGRLARILKGELLTVADRADDHERHVARERSSKNPRRAEVFERDNKRRADC